MSNLNTSNLNTPAPSSPRPPIDPHDPARYTDQQEREMGVVDDQGRRIQPAASFVMIALTFVGVAAVAVVVVMIVLRMMGNAPANG
jgi:hypothetical protein